MFFVAILGSYVILRGGSRELLAEHAKAMNKWAAGFNTLVLIFSSLTMGLAVDASQKRQKRRLVQCLAATLACAFTFMGVKAYEYHAKWVHETIVAHEGDAGSASAAGYVYDGHVHHEPNGGLLLTGYPGPRAEICDAAIR